MDIEAIARITMRSAGGRGASHEVPLHQRSYPAHVEAHHEDELRKHHHRQRGKEDAPRGDAVGAGAVGSLSEEDEGASDGNGGGKTPENETQRVERPSGRTTAVICTGSRPTSGGPPCCCTQGDDQCEPRQRRTPPATAPRDRCSISLAHQGEARPRFPIPVPKPRGIPRIRRPTRAWKFVAFGYGTGCGRGHPSRLARLQGVNGRGAIGSVGHKPTVVPMDPSGSAL